MYSKRFILDVLNAQNQSLSGGDSHLIKVPFGTEYKIYVKNDNDFDCAVDITVDGIRPLGFAENGKPNFLILPSKQKYLLAGDFNKNFRGGKKFKLVAMDSKESTVAGRVSGDSDNGVIEAKFYHATKKNPYDVYVDTWEKRLSEHERLLKKVKEMENELERERLNKKIRDLEREIERAKKYEPWTPWRNPWGSPQPPVYWLDYRPVWDDVTYEKPIQTLEATWNSSCEISTGNTRSLHRKSPPSQYKNTMDMMCDSQNYQQSNLSSNIGTMNVRESFANYASTNPKVLSLDEARAKRPELYENYLQHEPCGDSADLHEAVTERGSDHNNRLEKVEYEVGEDLITNIQLKLLGFFAPEQPVVSTVNAPSIPLGSFCPNCGSKLAKSGFSFCPHCGSKL